MNHRYNNEKYIDGKNEWGANTITATTMKTTTRDAISTTTTTAPTTITHDTMIITMNKTLLVSTE